MINTHQEGSEKFPTLFGFKTDNKIAANGLNTIYGIVMVVAMAFAYHALSLILVEWNSFLIFLAAIAVVGLPYCIKIIMYGRKLFTLNMAILCIAISLLPTIFDFIGFYSETSIRQSLVNTKFEVLEKLNYFDKEARKAINENIIELDKDYNVKLVQTEKDFNSKKSSLSQEVVDAQQTFIDETQGVSGRSTSGRIGIGPKSKELESEVRKAEARTELERKELEDNKQKEISRLTKDYETRYKSYQEGIDAINELVSSKDNKGLIFEVNRAKTFDELADTVVRLNTSVNMVSSKLGVEPEYVKFSTENVIQLSFGALTRFEITAVICFALALLLEIVDTIIVYMVRGVKSKEKEEKIEEQNAEIPTVVVDNVKKIVSVR
ncbi:MAG: hypothetical protein RL736_474 [Pseudomonadota bacterium]|jgi:hypothetical protein